MNEIFLNDSKNRIRRRIALATKQLKTATLQYHKKTRFLTNLNTTSALMFDGKWMLQNSCSPSPIMVCYKGRKLHSTCYPVVYTNQRSFVQQGNKKFVVYWWELDLLPQIPPNLCINYKYLLLQVKTSSTVKIPPTLRCHPKRTSKEIMLVYCSTFIIFVIFYLSTRDTDGFRVH